MYSDLLSQDGKSTLIVLGIDENIYSHETRKKILDQIEYVIESFKFDLTSFNNGSILFSNQNVLSEYAVGPFSVLESIINDIYQYNEEAQTLGSNLSIKSIQVEEEKQALKDYGSVDSGASLGDILGAALEEKASKVDEENSGAAKQKKKTKGSTKKETKPKEEKKKVAKNKKEKTQ